MTQIASLRLAKLVLPGRAGDLQQQGATPALIRELGSNYDLYHRVLAGALQEKQSLPSRSAHPRYEDYFDAWVDVEDLVRAEMILRICWDYLNRGRTLDSPMADDHGDVLHPPVALQRSTIIP